MGATRGAQEPSRLRRTGAPLVAPTIAGGTTTTLALGAPKIAGATTTALALVAPTIAGATT